MKNQKTVLSLLALVTLYALGCGSNPAGTYTGTETVQQPVLNGGANLGGYGYGTSGYSGYSGTSGYGGTYSGTPSGSITTTSQNSGVTITINSVNNNNVSGNWSSSNGNGPFTGTLSSDGNTITGVNLNFTSSNNPNTNYNGNYSPVNVNCSGVYTGNLSLANAKTLSGSLSTGNTQGGLCPSSRSLNATKQ